MTYKTHEISIIDIVLSHTTLIDLVVLGEILELCERL